MTAARHKQLLEALRTVERGLREGERLSVLKVAAAAGVSGALIHNRYPDIAERIRQASGKGARAQRDQSREALAEARHTIADLRHQLRVAQSDIRRLASLNLSLSLERDDLKARVNATNVTPLSRPKRS